jgi:hypothetical protein
VDDTAPGASPSNPFPVSARSGGDVVLDVTLWRPQRRPTSEAECRQPPAPNCAQTEWIDMGGLVHYATGGPSDRHYAAFCPQNAYSNPDSALTPFSPDPGAGGLLDRAGARPADPANTLAYRLNLTRCLAAERISFNLGETRAFAFQASTLPGAGGVTGVDNAHQAIFFRRAG